MKRTLLISLLLLAVIFTVSADRRRLMGARNVAAAAGNNITADLWQTFEGALDATGLQANDNHASATWTVDNAASLLSIHANAERATVSTVNTVSDTGSTGLKRVYTSTALGGLTVNLGTDYSAVSFGVWFKFSENPSVNHTLFQAQNNGGSGAIPDSIAFRYSTRYLGWGSAGNSIGTALSAATWYWVTVHVVQNGTCTIQVYNEAGTKIGSDATGTAPNNAFRKLYPFNYNAETSDGTLEMYMDDLVIDYADATYPLGP